MLQRFRRADTKTPEILTENRASPDDTPKIIHLSDKHSFFLIFPFVGPRPRPLPRYLPETILRTHETILVP